MRYLNLLFHSPAIYGHKYATYFHRHQKLLVRAYDEQLMSPRVRCAENQLNHSENTQKMYIFLAGGSKSLATKKKPTTNYQLQEHRAIFDIGLGGFERH